MRGFLALAGFIALIALTTPLLAHVTGDWMSAAMIELMLFITAESLLGRTSARQDAGVHSK
jgi:hypothetical protein